MDFSDRGQPAPRPQYRQGRNFRRVDPVAVDVSGLLPLAQRGGKRRNFVSGLGGQRLLRVGHHLCTVKGFLQLPGGAFLRLQSLFLQPLHFSLPFLKCRSLSACHRGSFLGSLGMGSQPFGVFLTSGARAADGRTRDSRLGPLFACRRIHPRAGIRRSAPVWGGLH